METFIPDWDLENTGPACQEYFTKKIKKPFTEDTMIDILKNQRDWLALFEAAAALRKTGTEKSIAYLKDTALHYAGPKKLDIQGNCALTIAKLAGGAENEFLGALLLNRNFKNKWYAMAALFYTINEKAVPYVLEYCIKNIKRSKNMSEAGGLALAYLAKYAPEDTQSKKIFSRTNNDFEELDNAAKAYLQNEYPDIFGVK